MGTQHTPGPWFVKDNHVYADDPNEPGEPWMVGSFDLMCGFPEIQDEANANVAAAAPELLAAFENMVTGWRYIRAMHDDLAGVGWDRAEEIATEAIARAKGEA